MTFIKENFLLETPQAEELYHGYAKEMPIIDYHNHLSPEHVANEHQFKNLTEAWLTDDHYKWRAMRACGIEETCITGMYRIRKSFKNGRRLSLLHLEIPCIIGLVWSCNDILTLMICLPGKMQNAFFGIPKNAYKRRAIVH